MLYAYTDFQGSLMALTDVNGNTVERYAYDPWGLRRNPDDWTQNDSRTHWIVNRGYTGHEHLDAFGIINMNGRVYDPLTAMFFSPDPYVQAPDNWLNYNRYGYCYGNPFKYTDPSGEFFFVPILIGAAIGAAGYTASVAFSDGGFKNWNWGQFAKAAGIGAISGVVTAGIGSAFGSVGGTGSFLGNVGKELGRAYVHGFANGMISEFTGGDFMQGFASGALGSLGGSAFQAVGGKFAESLVGTVGFSALSGGIGAELSGGDFWRGAATGATVGLLNHGMHKAEKIIRSQFNKTRDAFMVYKMIAEAEGLSEYEKALLFKSLVETNSEYDLKNNKRFPYNARALKNHTINFEGMKLSADDIGNYNFGIGAKAFGYSLRFAKFGAGMYQTFFQKGGDWTNFNGWFDYSRDTEMIIKGYNRFR